MNTTINTYLKGSYIIQNEKGEILAEVDNSITDPGLGLIKGGWIGSFCRYLALNPDYGNGASSNSNTTISASLIPRADGLLQYNFVAKAAFNLENSLSLKSLGTTDYITGGANGYTIPSAQLYSLAPLTSFITFSPGTQIIVTYTLQYITDCNKVITGISFLSDTTNAIPFPASKTNARHVPVLFTPPEGYNSSFNVYVRGTMSVGSHNLYSGNIYRTSLKLAFYSDIDIFASMSSTTSSISSTNTIASISNAPLTCVYSMNPSSYKESWTSNNTFTVILRFMFEPGQWPITAKGFSLISCNTNFNPDNAKRSTTGIFTALQTPYNPYSKDPNMYVGLDYTFNWIRS